jgi:hypothetical protein
LTKKLFSFYWDCGRMGSLEGLFAATQEEVDEVIGEQIHFGEVLGKHSDICGELESEDLTIIDLDQEAIDKIVAVTGTTISGFNPIETYWSMEEEYVDDE